MEFSFISNEFYILLRNSTIPCVCRFILRNFDPNYLNKKTCCANMKWAKNGRTSKIQCKVILLNSWWWILMRVSNVFWVSINLLKCWTFRNTSLKCDLSEEIRGLKIWKPLKVLVQFQYILNVSWNFIKSLVIKARNIELVIREIFVYVWVLENRSASMDVNGHKRFKASTIFHFFIAIRISDEPIFFASISMIFEF